MPSAQRHEATWRHIPGEHLPRGVLLENAQLLCAVHGADGCDHAPTRLELFEQRLRNVIGCGRDDNDVERRVLRPSHITIAEDEVMFVTVKPVGARHSPASSPTVNVESVTQPVAVVTVTE